MNTEPLNKMLKESTLKELSMIVDFATLIQVARFDCFVGTIDGSKRNVDRDGIIYDEAVCRLASVGVTHKTERIVMACINYEYDIDVYDKIVKTLREHLKEWIEI